MPKPQTRSADLELALSRVAQFYQSLNKEEEIFDFLRKRAKEISRSSPHLIFKERSDRSGIERSITLTLLEIAPSIRCEIGVFYNEMKIPIFLTLEAEPFIEPVHVLIQPGGIGNLFSISSVQSDNPLGLESGRLVDQRFIDDLIITMITFVHRKMSEQVMA